MMMIVMMMKMPTMITMTMHLDPSLDGSLPVEPAPLSFNAGRVIFHVALPHCCLTLLSLSLVDGHHHSKLNTCSSSWLSWPGSPSASYSWSIPSQSSNDLDNHQPAAWFALFRWVVSLGQACSQAVGPGEDFYENQIWCYKMILNNDHDHYYHLYLTLFIVSCGRIALGFCFCLRASPILQLLVSFLNLKLELRQNF